MRILGACPSCEALDLMFADPARPLEMVQCHRCRSLWQWRELTTNKQYQGRRFIPVSLFARRSAVELVCPPKREIPWVNTIALVFQIALLVKYPRLRTNFSAEGGVEGIVGNREARYVSLQTSSELLGLDNEDPVYLGDPWRASDWVLRFYARLMRQLFEEPLRFRRTVMRPGAILWLKPEGADEQIEAWKILALVLRIVGGAGFLERFQERLRKLHPLEKMYLRGPTDTELIDRFVMPPEFEHLFGSREP